VSARIVGANGVALCAETFGDPAHPAVVLLHGAGNDMLSWDERLCERLADGGRYVVRCDFRDAGRSVTYPPGEPPYGLRDLVADTVGLLDALGIERAHLAGMSMGASVAQLVALEHPGRVATITLVGTTPGDPSGEAGDLPGPEKRLFADPPASPDWDDRAATVAYLVEAHRPYSAAFDEPAMRALQGRVYDRANDIAANAANHFAMDSGGPWRARLGEIAAPALVLHGAQDPMFPPDHARALAREIPGAELVLLERTGHEYLPPHTWNVAVPALLRHTSGGD
jgi:pimeloyl-ACP methyl ester carboxylesterase